MVDLKYMFIDQKECCMMNGMCSQLQTETGPF